MALTPIALIPQVVLGGLMVPMTTNPNLRPLMYLMPSRWGFEGAIASERLAIAGASAWNIDLHKPDLTSLPDFVQDGEVPVRRRPGREQLARRRVGLHRVGHALDAGGRALRHDLRDVRHPAHRAEAAGSRLARAARFGGENRQDAKDAK